MTSSSQHGPPRGRGAFPSPFAGQYISGCSRALDSALYPLLAALFVRIDDALYDLADKATSSRPYTIYFEAMRVIRKQSQAIQQSFRHLLHQTAESAAAGLLECDLLCDSDTMSQDLSLQQEADLEETLALDNLISKAELRYGSDLVKINTALAHLLDRRSVDLKSNPFGPAAICEAFRGALNAVRPLESQIRLVIYKVFDRQVLDRLAAFYGECVDAAVAAGYIPPTAPNEAPPPAPAAPPSDEGLRLIADSQGGIGLDPGSAEDSAQVAFETLQDLLGRRRNATAEDPAALPTRELQGLLSELGAHLLAEGAAVGIAVRERLLRLLGSPAGARHNLERNDQDTLDLVFMFFEYLCESRSIPEPIKVLIGRMQIPVAKLALLDKDFFCRQDHPARLLLNHIGEAAVGWCEADGRGPETLYGMIERVVERLILDFDRDPRLFGQMDRFLLAYLAQERVHAREAEAQALAAVGPAADGTAQQVVTAALEAALIRAGPVPAVVESILREGWLPVMLAAWQNGAAGPDWSAALDLMERLLWSVKPKTHSEDRRQLLRRIPEILRVLRSRLSAAGCDQRRLAAWFRDLQTLHLSVLQGACPAPAAAPHPVAAPAASTAAGVAASTPGRAAAIPLGSWIELEDNDRGRPRYRLVWRSPDGDRLLFVDRQGRPGPGLSGRGLAEQLALGRAILVGQDQLPAADRAMRAVIGRLAANS